MKNEMAPPESAKGLWYEPTINRFKDDTGGILHDLTALFPTWQLDMWKKGKDYALLKDRRGELWELFYAQNLPLEFVCPQRCGICPSRCEVYELFYSDQIIF